MLRPLLAAAALLAFTTTASPGAAQRPGAAQEPAVAPALFDGMSYRMVGPFRGGRATAVTGIPDQPHVFFMGTTGGGIWKTDDAGGHWTSVSDGFLDVGNIGALDVSASDPRIIYAGTGSAPIRGNSSVGRGVWKSVDGGASWQFIGLRESGAIGKLVIHPTNPDVVYVTALGHPFGKNPERGIYRTRDGGATWDHVLFLNDSTGAVTISMSPDNPDELYAGMWRGERKPWTMISGGAEGGVYRTRDGGDTWHKLAGGLPTGLVGKTGVSISPADPDRIWALIEAQPGGGLYRSDDRGETWTLVNEEARVRNRPWYYTHVRADPVDRDRVYVLNVPLLRSEDGGATFTALPIPHGDVHDIWINPRDNRIFAMADDGGTVVTLNDGRTFSTMYNQPTAELYDVVVDNQIPYRLYGSQQDNSSISVFQRRLHNTLRPQQEWLYAGGCETGPIALHPDHPEIVFGGCYGGLMNRFDTRNDTRVSVSVYPENMALAPRDLTNRWQWVAPIVVSPHDRNTVYYASQYLYRSRDLGDTWQRISPDLTTNDTTLQRWPGGPITPEHGGVEIFTTIFAVAPSPHDARTIWVGSDDGRVHITRDDGATWTDITPPGMPRRGTVNRIDVSAHAAGRAFIAVHRYRENDFAPYIFRTNDYGRTWQRLADGGNGIAADHPVRVMREDDVRRGLLYAGTEFGAYVSFDDGVRWQSLQLNLPASPITDMQVHRGDLVLSTQGRSFWILDDLTPLRELAADRTTRRLRLYTPRPAARGYVGAPLREVDHVLPDDLPHGALIHYVLSAPAPDLEIDILRGGTVVRSFRADSAAAARLGTRRLATDAGFHRLVWDLRGFGPLAFTSADDAGAVRGQGVKLPPAEYSVTIRTAGMALTRPVVVTGNPRAPEIGQADYELQHDIAAAVRDTITEINRVTSTLQQISRSAAATLARADSATALSADDRAQLQHHVAALQHRVAEIQAVLTPGRPDGQLAAPAGLSAHYATLYGTLVGDGGYGSGSAEGRPSAGRIQRMRDLDAQWSELRARYEALQREELARFEAAARTARLPTR
jgi:photosystem II stability/assembly factor-like uncharacterized protein